MSTENGRAKKAMTVKQELTQLKYENARLARCNAELRAEMADMEKKVACSLSKLKKHNAAVDESIEEAIALRELLQEYHSLAMANAEKMKRYSAALSSAALALQSEM